MANWRNRDKKIQKRKDTMNMAKEFCTNKEYTRVQDTNTIRRDVQEKLRQQDLNLGDDMED